jgi:hypothetical protein
MQQALEEYSECLKIRKAILGANDRKLAEAHYFVAVASTFLQLNKEALTHFIMAKKILESKLTTLLQYEEIKEIKEILVDLQDKVKKN